MAQARKKAANRSRDTAARMDAIALLKADHRQVEAWFEEFENAGRSSRKAKLASQICEALRAHMAVEEELFYPAFHESAGDEDMHDEAIVEHAGAKHLMDQIESGNPGDELYDAKVTVLGEMIKHHVREEEQRDGMFAKARQSDMDLRELGERIAERKRELQAGSRSSRRRA